MCYVYKMCIFKLETVKWLPVLASSSNDSSPPYPTYFSIGLQN